MIDWAKYYNEKFKEICIKKTHIKNFSGLEEYSFIRSLEIRHSEIQGFLDIPDQMEHLESIVFKYNEIHAPLLLPQKLPEISAINLNSNNLKSLGKFPQQLDSIKAIILSENPISDLSPIPSHLPNLDLLYMKGCDLRSLDSLRSEMPKLEELDLSDNQLTSLPDWVGNLTRLKKLKLEKNQFKKFPECLLNLDPGCKVTFKKNPVESRDTMEQFSRQQKREFIKDEREVEALIALERQVDGFIHRDSYRANPGYDVEDGHVVWLGVDLRHGVDNVTKKIGEFTQLSFLRMGGGKTLPESIGNLKNLRVFKLTHGDQTELPARIGELENLKKLKLRADLHSLPESIGKLKNLEVLDICWNKLTTLPESIGNLTQLRKLKAEENEFDGPPASIYPLKQLEVLRLGHIRNWYDQAVMERVGNGTYHSRSKYLLRFLDYCEGLWKKRHHEK